MRSIKQSYATLTNKVKKWHDSLRYYESHAVLAIKGLNTVRSLIKDRSTICQGSLGLGKCGHWVHSPPPKCGA